MDKEFLGKEKMVKFIEAVKSSGLVLGEPGQYQQQDPHAVMYNRFRRNKSIRPWEVVDQ